MELNRGTVVRILAGHDKGLLMAVTGSVENRILVADGKTRTVRSPKKKNVIHLETTATVLNEEEMKSDKTLRGALRRPSEASKNR